MRLYLARIYLRRAVMEMIAAATTRRWKIPAAAQGWVRKATRQLAYPGANWQAASKLEQRIAMAYRAYTGSEWDRVRTLCKAGLAAFGRQPGTEAFVLLLGLTARSETERTARFEDAVARCPHGAWAIFLRGFFMQRTDRRAARRDLDRALEINPYLGPAYDQRARMHFDAGRMPERHMFRKFALASADSPSNLRGHSGGHR